MRETSLIMAVIVTEIGGSTDVEKVKTDIIRDVVRLQCPVSISENDRRAPWKTPIAFRDGTSYRAILLSSRDETDTSGEDADP